MDTRPLHRWLDRALELPPEYRDQLTNHLPMALHALHAMGAGEARLAAFFDLYARRFEGRRSVSRPAVAAEARRWRAWREGPDPFPMLRAAFAAALAREGREAVLHALLPGLLEGAAAAAFHGAIRTAHAVESGHDGELAAALAYWAWRWQPLPLPVAGDPWPFDRWAARLAAAAAGLSFEGPLISVRMAAAAGSAPYRELGARLAAGADLLPRLSALAAAHYAASGNFTLLHLVTGTRALRVLVPWAGPEATPHVLAAWTAAFLAARLPALERAPLPPRPWEEIVPAACAQDDDHVIKLVHACREGARHWGDEALYRRAATRALG